MAKILDETGRYVSQEAVGQRRKILAGVLAFTAVLCTLSGYFVGEALRKSPPWMHALAFVAFLGLLRLVFIWSRRRIEELEQERTEPTKRDQMSGPIGAILRKLPDAFRVVGGLNTPLGTIDHVVVGPTGIVALDEQNWKGVISADAQGELLWNGHPTDRPLVREFAAKVAEVQKSFDHHAGAFQPQVRGLLVFTAAVVNINTPLDSGVECLRSDQLQSLILESSPEVFLRDGDVENLAQALLALVRSESKTPALEGLREPAR